MERQPQWKGETPPRAWGRQGVERLSWHEHRNTPTGVGKTGRSKKIKSSFEKHPHGRGEDAHITSQDGIELETPPRAWGRRIASHVNLKHFGNTPTGVGKTRRKPAGSHRFEKHPHGRGEDDNATRQGGASWETPPRAWGRHRHGVEEVASVGNTPTGVGKTAFRTVNVARI